MPLFSPPKADDDDSVRLKGCDSSNRCRCKVLASVIFLITLSVKSILLCSPVDNDTSMKSRALEMEKAQKQNRYAYAFVVGGCGGPLPTYRNYLYNILVATHLLRQDGSSSDVVAFFQMSSETEAEELPEKEVRWLQTMGIKVYYIPKMDAEHDSFYSFSIQKFRILQLTQYRRVLVMDADVIPFGSLDYLFEMSEYDDLLKENVIVPNIDSPANAGFFMLAPYDTAVHEVNDIVRDTEDRNKASGFFHKHRGWGHVIKKPDYWEKPKLCDNKWSFKATRGDLWDFVGAGADQGLLYHFVKYHRKQVSIILGDTIKNYGSGNDGNVVLEKTIQNPFASARRPAYRGLLDNCRMYSNTGDCPPPLSDFEHFNSENTPWVLGAPDDLSLENKTKSPLHLWFWELTILNEKLHLGLEHQLRHWSRYANSPPFGRKPFSMENQGARTNLLAPIKQASSLLEKEKQLEQGTAV